MSTILSKIDDINNLNVEPFPTNKTLKGAKIVRIGRTICAVDEKGQFYSTQVDKNVAYSFGINLEDTLQGAKRLGLLSKTAVDQHINLARLRDIRRDRRNAADGMLRYARTLGLKLTNAQQGAIERAQKEASQ
jgi:hypothetical protein